MLDGWMSSGERATHWPVGIAGEGIDKKLIEYRQFIGEKDAEI
jgi:hypothetical protein